MHLTDTHIHLQDYPSSEAQKIYNCALKNNIYEFVIPSAHPSDWSKVIKTTRRFSGAIGAAGIHPWYIEDTTEKQLELLEEYLNKNSNLWVGECGIDRIKNPDTSKQIFFFTKQAELAVKYHRPLLVHCVKADNEMEKLFPLLPKNTLFHSFNGSLEWGKKLQKHGFYLGLNLSFFKKENSAEILSELNLDKLLLETDAPYQQNNGYIKNSPENLPVLATALSSAYGLSETEIIAILNRNFNEFKEK